MIFLLEFYDQKWSGGIAVLFALGKGDLKIEEFCYRLQLGISEISMRH
jgi:hypothetical protein